MLNPLRQKNKNLVLMIVQKMKSQQNRLPNKLQRQNRPQSNLFKRKQNLVQKNPILKMKNQQKNQQLSHHQSKHQQNQFKRRKNQVQMIHQKMKNLLQKSRQLKSRSKQHRRNKNLVLKNLILRKNRLRK